MAGVSDGCPSRRCGDRVRNLRGLVARKARRSEPPKKKKESAPAITVAPSPGPPLLRLALTIASALYIGAVFIEGAGGHLDRLVARPSSSSANRRALSARRHPPHRIPGRGPPLPRSGRRGRRTSLFPIHADDKESRFDRALHFYRSDCPTMEALESYVRSGYNRQASEKIAGVVFLSLRVPIPQPVAPLPATNARRSLISPKSSAKFGTRCRATW